MGDDNGLAGKLNNDMAVDLKVPNCSIIHYLDLATTDMSRAVCISIMELEQSTLEDPAEDEYYNI